MKAIRFFYNLVFPFVLLALLPGFLFRIFKRGKYRHKFGQRFGIYSPRVQDKLSVGDWTWVHAVSVGEVLIALKFIREMKRQDATLRVVLSTTTSTGFALANQEKSDWLEPIYNPVDFFWPVARAIRLIRPRRLILVEAEVWPNLTAAAKAQGARLALINARLSTRSEARYRRVKFLAAPIFNQLNLLGVQEPADAVRWEALGVEKQKIACFGSIKFDEQMESPQAARDFRPVLRALNVPDDALILMAASTHAGEELLVGKIFLKLRERFPHLFYLAIPRHAERGKEVRAELEKIGLRVALRQGETQEVSEPDAFVINTTGELRDWYACANAVFIGKSLLAKGGQNPAEAVAAGKAVFFGPNMQNFATLTAQLIREQGAIQVDDAQELERALESFFTDPTQGATLAERGSRCLAVHQGATARTAEAVLKLS